ncbi:unnamed protein product [Ilex paraguariensis]|uniref:Uncharacterized protein n=1 Tax=Ilex paraguariensis TaxID=185542 RepID=A0ABC8T1P7_9AQUA
MTTVENITSTPAQRSPWHSPVPYLFGGLAAMLGLIAFALLILACSYWKLSGHLDGDEREGSERDIEAGEVEKKNTYENLEVPTFLVLMAGQEKPTFLATPISSRASSFGSNSEKREKKDEGREKQKHESGVQVQMVCMETHETTHQVP